MPYDVYVVGLAKPIRVTDEVGSHLKDLVVSGVRPNLIDIAPADEKDENTYYVSAEHISALVEVPEKKKTAYAATF